MIASPVAPTNRISPFRSVEKVPRPEMLTIDAVEVKEETEISSTEVLIKTGTTIAISPD